MNKLCWVITDGSAGMENQAIGLGEALGYKIIVKRIILKKPWIFVAPYIRIGKKYCISKLGDQISAPWPELVIACGRRSILPALYVKEAGPETKLVYLQDPRISSKHFDAIICPEHDKIKGDNVIKSFCAMHRISQENLSIGKSRFTSLFTKYKNPRIGVLIGGTNRVYKYTEDTAVYIADKLIKLSENNDVSLIITTSRRTSDSVFQILQEKLANRDNIYLWDRKSDNPYFGILSLADILIITPDSVSMASEAAVTDKPIYMIDVEGGSKKFKSFHDYLLSEGRIRWLSDSAPFFKVKPIDETQMIIDKLKPILYFSNYKN